MSSQSTLAIETSGLVKTFGETRAVDGVDLAIPQGVVYGVLGPNGAGKTTTIRMLSTLLTPDGGTARVLGHDVVKEAGAVRSRVSLTGQFASIDEDLTATENLTLLARLLGFSRTQAAARAEELLAAFDLTEAAGRQSKTFSEACGAASTSPPASSSPPTCSSWTSRPPGSTRAAATRCGTACGPWWRWAPRSC